MPEAIPDQITGTLTVIVVAVVAVAKGLEHAGAAISRYRAKGRRDKAGADAVEATAAAAARAADADADERPIDQYRQLAKELRAEVRAVRTELQKVYQALADVRGEHDECRRALAIVTAQNANQQKQLDAHRDALRAAGLDAGSGPQPPLPDTDEHRPLGG